MNSSSSRTRGSGGKSAAKKRAVSASGAGSGSNGSTAEPCGKCRKPIIENSESSVECEVCHFWFHISCVEVLEELLDLLSTKGLHWFCSRCDNQFCKLEQIEVKVDKIQELVSSSIDSKISNIQKSYAEAVSKLETNSAVIANAARTSIKKEETESKNIRDKNIIIFGIQESNINDTIESVKSILEELHIHTTVDKDSLFRLGKYDNDKSDKCRPVKLCTESKTKKWDILKAVNDLRKPGVFARLDLSKVEQEEDFRLRKELQQIREKETTKKFKIKNKQIVEVKN